VTNTVR